MLCGRQSEVGRRKRKRKKRNANSTRSKRDNSNTAEGYEFKQQYLEEQRKASFLRSEIETRKREKEEGSSKLLKFQRKIDRLSANSRELWLVWDEERNWRIWEHMIDQIPKHNQIPYDKNLFYTEKPSRSDRDDDPYNFIHPGYAAAPNENIEKTGLARRRLETIQEFMKLNKKNKVPDEIRKFQEYRQKMDTKYKKENKRKHRLLFPGKKEERCITS